MLIATVKVKCWSNMIQVRRLKWKKLIQMQKCKKHSYDFITDGQSFVTRRGVNPLLLVDAVEETGEDHSFLLEYIVRQAYKLPDFVHRRSLNEKC